MPNDAHPVLAFISTRTEEMSLERRAAYEAAIACEVIPITYDASIHRLIARQVRLIDTSVVDGRNRRGQRRIIWDHISTFVDTCDVFIGVYCRTLGHADPAAADQPWLQFELLRFIVSHEMARGAAWVDPTWGSSDDALRLRGLHDRIRDVLSDQTEDAEVLRQFLEQRVWLYRWEDVDGRRSDEPDLHAFLAPFAPLCLRTFSDRVHELPRPSAEPELRPVRPAHAELFAALRGRLAELVPTRERARLGAADAGLYFDISETTSGMTRPGGLYVLLRDCFQLGLQIECMLAGNDGHWHVRGLAASFADPVGVDPQAREGTLRDALERHLVGYSIELRAATSEDHQDLIHSSEVKVFRKRQRSLPEARSYRVRIGDVPGTFWTIVSLATAFGATIVHLSYDRRWDERPEDQKVGFSAGSPVVEFELGLARSEESLGEESWTNFEYLLKCVHGYISSHIVQTERV